MKFAKTAIRCAVFLGLFAPLVLIAQVTAAAEPPSSDSDKAVESPIPAVTDGGDCPTLAAMMREHQAATARDLRQIKRDMAMLRQSLDKPGIAAIFSGIGYIFGLFGVAAFVASRSKKN
ncbi:MAG: hypothetical protein LBU39_09925 [Desulfobulbaceae bacterium]|jgi:hypothetical protein|nr:hypothetical protein [Desulfobulbaceae bacterium]